VELLGGGKDNFAADREAAERVLEVMPSMPVVARLARRFLIGAVHQLAAGHGIRQFLDIGTGLPTADNTHDVAQRAAPESRIVYVDNDPVVLTHARALLTSSPEGKTDYIQADLRDTPGILAEVARRYNELSSVPVTPRSREQVSRFFDGLDVVGPGVVPISQWGPHGEANAGLTSGLVGYCGIGRKR
jgi:hypothetical protein